MVVLGPEGESNGCPNCGVPVYQAEALLAGKDMAASFLKAHL